MVFWSQRLFRTIVTTLSLAVLTQCSFAAGPNLVRDNGFEEGGKAWTIAPDTATVDNTVAHGGKSSLRYENNDPERYALFAQEISALPGQVLEISAWVKGADLAPALPGQGAGVYVSSADAQKKYIDGVYPQSHSGTYDWKQIKAQYTVPANATQVWVGLRFTKKTTGTAWFDDVSVSTLSAVPTVTVPEVKAPAPKAGTNVVKDNGFEEGGKAWTIAPNTATVDNTVAHSGKNSLRYENNDPEKYALFAQEISVLPGQVLEVSAWVKGADLAPALPGQGAGVYVSSADAQKKYIDGAFTQGHSGTYDWKQIKTQYTVPANATQVWVGLRLTKKATGTVWFDDINVTVISAEPKVEPKSAAPVARVIAPIAEGGLLKNNSFEEGNTAWAIPADTATVDNTVAHGGQSSLRYQNDDPERYVLFIQEFPAVPGQVLKISAWIKGEAFAYRQGAGVYVESVDAQNKYINGAYSHAYSGTFDWTQAEAQYTVPTNATKLWVGLRLTKKTTGTAWFDDVNVSVLPPEPMVAAMLYPNYRGMLVRGDRTPWQMEVRADPFSDWNNEEIQIKNTLSDSTGKVLSSTNIKTKLAVTPNTITLPTPSDLPIGKYSLVQEVSNSKGKTFTPPVRTIQVVEKFPKVYIDAQGFTVVDGKRFFPMGIYSGPEDTEHLQRISQAGFNTILSYRYGRGPNPKDFIERARSQKLKVIYSIKDMYQGMRSNETGNLLDIAADQIRQMRDEDVLLAWYTNDELDPGWIPKLQKMYEQVVQLDPNHPAYQVMGQPSFAEGRLERLEKYYDVTDVLGIDHYMTGTAPNLIDNTIDTRMVVTATKGKKGVWMVPQIFDVEKERGKPPHTPTRDELRNESYQSLINGATGFVFYSYFDLPFANNPRFKDSDHELFLKQWSDITAMVKELNGFVPAILENRKVALALPPSAEVEAAAWEHQGKLLIALANPYYQEKQITFTLPRGWKIKETTQGQIKSTLAGGKVTFTMPSVGSGVFTLQR